MRHRSGVLIFIIVVALMIGMLILHSMVRISSVPSRVGKVITPVAFTVLYLSMIIMVISCGNTVRL